jgi:hypothetical protein
MKNIEKMSKQDRLKKIAYIIESVDHRAMAADGPVSLTREEITTRELCEIYALATGSSEYLQ